MNTMCRAAVALIVLLPMSVASAQSDFQSIDSWIVDGGPQVEIRKDSDSVVVRRGAVWAPRLYSDFVLRFEFRLQEPNSEARVFVRSRFGYVDRAERGYRVELAGRTDANALGRVSGAGVNLKIAAFHPAPIVAPDQWQECEIRADGARLSVRVNGALVTEAQALDEFTGYVAIQVSRGAIVFQNLRAARQPSASDSFGQGAYRASESGIVMPRALKTAKPFYPREPHGNGIEGSVRLELVVDSSGSVGDIRVAKSLHPDLDEAAIGSARKWRFRPGTKSGQPVPVIVTMEVSFRPWPKRSTSTRLISSATSQVPRSFTTSNNLPEDLTIGADLVSRS
jgi:TonB family protein